MTTPARRETPRLFPASALALSCALLLAACGGGGGDGGTTPDTGDVTKRIYVLSADAGQAGPVAAVVVTTLAVWALGLDARGVRIVGEVPQGLPPLGLPPMNLAGWATLAPAAFLIALIGFVESVSVAQTLAAKRRQSIRPDQELIGLGAANLVAAFSGGFPVTGGFARSVVNFDAGAATPAAGAFTAGAAVAGSLMLRSSAC